AEPNACGACGPAVRLIDREGTELSVADDAIAAAVDALASGRIVAVKGLGGYHLAVDATDEAAVTELRRRKARDDKPFAVMVADRDEARRLCELTPEAEEALESVRRPIVLAPKAAGATGLSPRIAPGLPELGLM